MKMFLLGMLTMYLGTTIITTIASIWIDTDDFLEIVFFFPLAMIAKIIKQIKNFIEVLLCVQLWDIKGNYR